MKYSIPFIYLEEITWTYEQNWRKRPEAKSKHSAAC